MIKVSKVYIVIFYVCFCMVLAPGGSLGKNGAKQNEQAVTVPKDYPVRPVPFTKVRISEGFWFPRMETNRKVTIPFDFRKCEETGRIDNFAKAGGLMDGRFEGIYFNDSDVFKVMEGAAYSLSLHPDPELEKISR
jgi:DUF1680 family protein